MKLKVFIPQLARICLLKPANFLKQITKIFDVDINLIIQATKTLLFNEGIPDNKSMGKKGRKWEFWCSDGLLCVVEVCELVGSFVLQQLSQLLEHYSAGFYRHDGLAILKRLSGPEVERVKKKIMKVFKDCRLKITIKADLHILNFLDITLIYVITSMSRIGNQTIILYTLTKTLTIQKLFWESYPNQ